MKRPGGAASVTAIAKGRLTALDTDAAQKAPGVLAVITASNARGTGRRQQKHRQAVRRPPLSTIIRPLRW
ncbi:hypothetical protein ACLBR5_26330 [Escherichia coli]